MYCVKLHVCQGRIQDFKLGGGALKKIAPSGGRREKFGVIRVKNHDFTPKNHIFSNLNHPWNSSYNSVIVQCGHAYPSSIFMTDIFIFDGSMTLQFRHVLYIQKFLPIQYQENTNVIIVVQCGETHAYSSCMTLTVSR